MTVMPAGIFPNTTLPAATTAPSPMTALAVMMLPGWICTPSPILALPATMQCAPIDVQSPTLTSWAIAVKLLTVTKCPNRAFGDRVAWGARMHPGAMDEWADGAANS